MSVYSPYETVKTVAYEDEAGPSAERPFVVKIHGDVENPASTVITDEDYIQFVLRTGHKEPFHPIPSPSAATSPSGQRSSSATA